MKYSELHITSMVSGKKVSFKAYITDMTQTFSSTWNTEEVFGRNDPIAMFQGTKRTISLALDVPAADRNEAEENLKKCSKLATFLYPGYTPWEPTKANPDIEPAAMVGSGENIGSYISRPPLIKIKFANLIDSMRTLPPLPETGVEALEEYVARESFPPPEGLLGYIDSYTFTPVMEAGMFGTTYPLFPRTISLSLNFNVLHQVDLGYEVDGTAEINWMATKLPFS